MKKILLLCFVFSFTSIFAQNWNPFPLGQKSFYESSEQQFYNGFDTSITVIHYDTVMNRGDFQTLFFSYNDENYNSCYENVYFNPNQGIYSQSGYYLNRTRPDSITIKNDTLCFYFVSMYSQTPDSILFLPKTTVGNSWFSTIHINGSTFNRLQFTCDSVFLGNVIGNISDSLKIFSIQAFDNSNPVPSIFDNQKIVLSKNYGYKQMVVFNGNLQQPLSLIGISTDVIQQGFDYPDFTDYFHLNSGDVIIWREGFQGDIMNPNYTKYYKDSIMNSFLSIDSIYYNIQRQQQNGSISTFNQKYLRKDFEWLTKPTSIFVDASIYSFSGYMDLWDSYPIFRSSNNTINREVEYFGNSLDTSNCFIGSITDVNSAYRYNTKLGHSHSRDWGFFMTTWDVLGSTINGVQEGVLWSTLVTGINSFETNNVAKIYPNPNKGIFTVEAENVKTVEIVSIEGKILFSQTVNQNKTNIKTDLPKGMYLVKLTFDNNKQEIKQLIITD